MSKFYTDAAGNQLARITISGIPRAVYEALAARADVATDEGDGRIVPVSEIAIADIAAGNNKAAKKAARGNKQPC